MTIEALTERCEDLEIKLAFQDKLLRDLDELVRALGDRLAATERELAALKASVRSAEPTLGPANEPPPHY